MPQLDKFAFAPQVFWLVLFFFILYLLLLKDGLSTLYKVLTFRKKLLLHLNANTTNFLYESFFLHNFSHRLFVNFVSTRNIVDSIFKVVDSSLVSNLGQSTSIRLLRVNLVNLSMAPVYVGARQALLPAIKQYSSLKLV